MKFKKSNAKTKYKFCPVCGSRLEIDDKYCTTCGYSFEARQKKNKKGIKWKNIIILLVILAIIYAGFQYLNGHPIIPESILKAFNITNSSG